MGIVDTFHSLPAFRVSVFKFKRKTITERPSLPTKVKKKNKKKTKSFNPLFYVEDNKNLPHHLILYIYYQWSEHSNWSVEQ